MLKTYNERRIFLTYALQKLDFEIHSIPQGAFYVLADAKNFTSDSYYFCLRMLNDAHVATTAGIDFGINAEGFVRFSYANNLNNIKQGVERIGTFLKTL